MHLLGKCLQLGVGDGSGGSAAKVGLIWAAVVVGHAEVVTLARPFRVIAGRAASGASVALGQEIGAAVVVRHAGRVALARLGRVRSCDAAPTDARVVGLIATQHNYIIIITNLIVHFIYKTIRYLKFITLAETAAGHRRDVAEQHHNVNGSR